jgi:hypothetical protein
VVTSAIVALNVSVLCTKSVAAQAFPRLLLHQAKFCSAFFHETPVEARMNGVQANAGEWRETQNVKAKYKESC